MLQVTYVPGKKTVIKPRQRLPLTFDVADLDVLGVRQGGDVDLGTRCLLEKTHVASLLANQPTNQVLRERERSERVNFCLSLSSNVILGLQVMYSKVKVVCCCSK